MTGPDVPHYDSWDDVPERQPTYRPWLGRPGIWVAQILWDLANRINHLSYWLLDWVTIDRGASPAVFTVPNEATARLLAQADRVIDDNDNEPT